MTGIDSPVNILSLTTALPSTSTESHSIVYPPKKKQENGNKPFFSVYYGVEGEPRFLKDVVHFKELQSYLEKTI